jgi:hypothetical protein
MSAMRGLALTVAVFVLWAGQAAAEGTSASSDSAAAEDSRAWSYSASLFGYSVPDDLDYAQPTIAADHGRWHVEARYNYEAQKTGSAWLGYSLNVGKQVTMELTPVLGGVFGKIHGIAPGYGLTLGWFKLGLDSDGEYFFDSEDDAESFFYNWTELYITPGDSWRAGLVAQRTRAYQTSLDIQRGFLAGASYGQADFTAYVFNLGWEDPTFVIAGSVSF